MSKKLDIYKLLEEVYDLGYNEGDGFHKKGHILSDFLYEKMQAIEAEILRLENIRARHELDMVLYGAARMKGLSDKATMREIASIDIGDYISERIERLENER